MLDLYFIFQREEKNTCLLGIYPLKKWVYTQAWKNRLTETIATPCFNALYYTDKSYSSYIVRLTHCAYARLMSNFKCCA